MEFMDGQANQEFRHSLSVIHSAKSQYDSHVADAATTDALMSKIGVCDVLLREIREIRAGLEKQRGMSRSLKNKAFGYLAEREDYGRAVNQ